MASLKTWELSSKLLQCTPPISRSMLDDYTSKGSFLAGFLVVVSLFISWYSRGDPKAIPFLYFPSLINVTCFQLDPIPTIGYSDPILSYLSALRFYFNSVPMLKEGYKKVICLIAYVPSSYRTDYAITFRQDQVYSKSPNFGDG